MQKLGVSGFLPHFELPAAPDGDPVRLRESGGKITVLVTVHGASCTGCLDYVRSLTAIAGELEVWDGRLLVVVPGELHAAARLPAPAARVLADEHARIADASHATVLVADRFGQIFHASDAGASHELPPAHELEGWLKYLGTLCPE